MFHALGGLESISMAQIGKHELSAQAHHGHQEDLGHGAHQRLNQGAECLLSPLGFRDKK
jgi:hypothetical protein